MKLAILLSAFVSLLIVQSDGIRVSFPPGTSSTVVKGTLSAENTARYVIHANAGQQMKVELSAPGADYRLFVFAPRSDDPLNGMGMAFEWTGSLPVTGDYLIKVFTDSRDRSLPFQLQISVTSGVTTGQEIQTKSEFSPDGYYVFNGRAPKGFENFKGFSLTTAEMRPNGTAVPVTPNGEIHAGAKYKMININLSGGSLSFEARPVRGASYKFAGKFLVNKGSCDENQTTGPVLSGHLIKLLNGSTLAEAEVKFEWSCSDI